jgi:hypothetical protein
VRTEWYELEYSFVLYMCLCSGACSWQGSCRHLFVCLWKALPKCEVDALQKHSRLDDVHSWQVSSDVELRGGFS